MNDLETVTSSLRRCERAMDHFEAVIRRCVFQGATMAAILPLLSRLLEFQRAAHALLKHDASAPVAIIVLARAQYEAFLAFRYLLLPSAEKEREKRARAYVKFSEFETVRAIADRGEYRASLSPEGQETFDRRVQIHDQVKAGLSRKQRKQGLGVTWNGMSIKQTAEAIGSQAHVPWYGLMSMVAHCRPAMSFKSITWDDPIRLGQKDEGRKESAEWLWRMSRVLSLAAIALHQSQGLEVSEEDSKIIKGLNKDSGLPRQQEDDGEAS